MTNKILNKNQPKKFPSWGHMLAIVIALCVNSSFAQTFNAQVKSTQVNVGEKFQIAFTLNASGSNFQAPSFSSFIVYSGPNQSQSMSIINGKMSRSITLSYILAAKEAGEYTINPARVDVNGKTLASNSISISVGKNNTKGQKNSPKGEPKLFVKTSINKSTIYQGERLTVTHKVYTPYQLLGFNDVKLPDYNGFWKQDVENTEKINLITESINGVNYQVAEIKTTNLFAQRNGELIIPEAVIECVVRKRSNKPARTLFDQVFGGVEDVVIKAKSTPTKITVLPLPEEGKPEGFSGAVGRFSFSASLSKDSIKANESITLKASIKGNGNLKLIDPLPVEVPIDFEKYDPKTSEKIFSKKGNVSGYKNFEYLFIPRHEGQFNIPPIAFSYFDPKLKKYVSLPSPEFTINVSPGDSATGNAVAFSLQKKAIEIMAKDIHFIKTDSPTITKKNDFLFGSTLFYLLLALPLIISAVFVFFYLKKRQENESGLTTKRQANKMALKHLSKAKESIANNDKESFYKILATALFSYLTDRFSIKSSELNKDTIRLTLTENAVSEEYTNELENLLEQCEFAQYAPGTVSDNLEQTYNNTLELITQIENEIV